MHVIYCEHTHPITPFFILTSLLKTSPPFKIQNAFLISFMLMGVCVCAPARVQAAIAVHCKRHVR